MAEFENFGWNVLTLGFMGTIVFTVFEAWGLYRQKKKIWSEESGKSVSVIMVAYTAALFTVMFIYGISVKKIAIVFNGGLLALMCVPILRGLWKFKGFSKLEKRMSVVLAAAVAVMPFVPFKDWFFLTLTFGNVFSLLAQPYEIWKNKDAGAVEIRLWLVFLTSTFFWVVYAFSVNDWVMKIISPAYGVINVLVIVLWLKYRR